MTNETDICQIPVGTVVSVEMESGLVCGILRKISGRGVATVQTPGGSLYVAADQLTAVETVPVTSETLSTSSGQTNQPVAEILVEAPPTTTPAHVEEPIAVEHLRWYARFPSDDGREDLLIGQVMAIFTDGRLRIKDADGVVHCVHLSTLQ